MKSILLSIAIFLSAGLFAQEEPQNLIPNPSFETDDGKVKKLGYAGKSLEAWTTATKTRVDLFTPGGIIPDVQTPNNAMGKANAKDGDNYIGIKVYDYNAKGGRAYLTAELVDHLEKGKRYCLSYSISLADVSKYATNNFGVHFSKRNIYEEVDVLLKDDVIIPSSNIIQKNMKTWTNVCVPFTAKGFEKHITLGNFHKSSKIATETMKKPKGIAQAQLPMGYYYIDNMSLLKISNDSDCNCAEEKLVEGPKIIYSKQEILPEGSPISKVVVSSSVYFYSLKSDLVVASNKELDRLATALAAKPDVKITIEGHSDSTEETRLKQEDDYVNLSEQRAEEVKSYLIAKGIDEGRLIVTSKKASQPTSKMKTPISLAKNRRVVFKTN